MPQKSKWTREKNDHCGRERYKIWRKWDNCNQLPRLYLNVVILIHHKVESGVCNNGWNYNLEFDVHNNHVISRHKFEKHFVLNHNKYKIMLKQQLEKRKKKKENNWDDEYFKWKVYRPKE